MWPSVAGEKEDRSEKEKNEWIFGHEWICFALERTFWSAMLSRVDSSWIAVAHGWLFKPKKRKKIRLIVSQQNGDDSFSRPDRKPTLKFFVDVQLCTAAAAGAGYRNVCACIISYCLINKLHSLKSRKKLLRFCVCCVCFFFLGGRRNKNAAKFSSQVNCARWT